MNGTDDRNEMNLSGVESDLDSVQEALAAVDADDLDKAEAIAASLTESDSGAPAEELTNED